jgi:hypothetical protein
MTNSSKSNRNIFFGYTSKFLEAFSFGWLMAGSGSNRQAGTPPDNVRALTCVAVGQWGGLATQLVGLIEMSL